MNAKTKKTRTARVLMASACMAALAGTAVRTLAAERTWSGAGDDNDFSTAPNWAGNIAPGPNDSLIFDGFARLTPSNDFAAGTAFDGITFAPTAGPFNLIGNQITLHGNIADNTPVLPQTLSLPLSLDATRGIAVTGGGFLTIGGVISGVSGAGIIKTGDGQLTLAGTNTFSGPVTINGGVLSVAAPANLGAAPATPTPGLLVIDGGTLQTTANITLSPNRGIALGPTAGSGAGTFDVATGTTLTYGGVISNNGAGAGGLNKIKFGTLALSGANTYTGPTRVMNGTLVLDFSQPGAPASNIVSSNSALSLGGANAGLGSVSHATLNVIGADNVANSQTFSGTTIDIGPAIIRASSGSNGSTTVNLGALTHNPGGVVNFVRPAAGNLNTTTPNTNGILGGWATIGAGNAPVGNITIGTEWASVDATGNIAPFTGHFDYVTGTEIRDTPPAGANVRINSGSTGDIVVDAPGSGTTTDVNTIQFANAAARSIQIGQGNTLRLGRFGGIFRSDATTGGITWAIGTSANGANGVQNEGTLTAGGADNTPGEIVFTMNSPSQTAGSLNVEARIADNGTAPVSVVKLGAGSMKLRGNNTYSGGTYILQGRLQLAGSEIGAGNPDGFGTGAVYIVPGAQMFPSGAGTAAPITNPLFIAGLGTSAEPIGVIRMGNGINIAGPVTLTGDARIGGGNGGQTRISGKISGPFNLDFGTPATIATNLMISNPENDWTGQTTLIGRNGGNAGHTVTLRLGANQVIPDGVGRGNVTILGGEDARTTTLELNGFSETINGLLSGGVLTNAIVQNSAAGTTSTLTVGNWDQTATFGGVIRDFNPTGSGGVVALTKIGSGIQTLTGNNTYSGDTNVDGGTLAITGSLPNSHVRVNAGGTLSGTGDGSTTGVIGTVTVGPSSGSNLARIATGVTSAAGQIGTLTINNLTSNSGDLKVDLVSGNSDRINVTGTASLPAGSATTISPNAGVKAGEYTILTAGALSIDPTATLTVNDPNDPSARPAAYNVVTDANSIKLNVTGGAKNITWTGATSGAWDINNTPNWRDDGNPAVVEKFFNGDTVTFTDTGANKTITLNQAVSPGGIIVNNSAGNDYAITGSGSIGGGGGLAKSGAGTLRLLTNNTYSGPTTISGGTIQVGDGGTTGSLGTGQVDNNARIVFNRSDNFNVSAPISGTGTIEKLGPGILTLSGVNTYTGNTTVTAGTLRAGAANALGGAGATATFAPGTTLDVNGQNLGAVAVSIGGTGVGGNGAIVNTGADQLNALQNVTLTADTLIGGTGRFDIRGDGARLSTDGQPLKLTKIGNEQFSLVGVTVDSALADIDVQGGTLAVETSTTGLGNPARTLRLAEGTALQLFNLATPLNKVIVSEGATLRAASGETNTIDGPITLTADSTLDATADDFLNINGLISGTGGVTKVGAATGVVNLRNTANTYQGPTVINGGVLGVTSLANGGLPSSIGQSGSAPSNLVINGGTLRFIGDSPSVTDRQMTLGGSATFNSSGGGTGSIQFNNPAPVTLAGNGSMTVTFGGENPGPNTLTPALGDRTGGVTSVVKNDGGLWILAGANTYTGPTTLNAGTLRVSGSIANTSSLTALGGARLETDGPQTIQNVNLQDATLVVRPGGLSSGVVKAQASGTNTQGLVFTPGSLIDLNTGGIIADYTAGNSNLDAIRSSILSGYNGGSWNGFGIFSTAAQTGVGAVGYGEAGAVLPGGGNFMGLPTDDTAVLLRYTVRGDANLDGAVGFPDLVALAQNYNNSSGTATWNIGDFDYDGNVGFSDLVALAQNYNSSLPTPGSFPGAFEADLARAFAQVPEPHALLVLAAGAVGLGGRRRRRK